jgi:hypothetical protein
MTCHVPGCGSTDTRLYQTGDCCPTHTPAAMAGRPEPESLVDPARTLDALRQAAGTTFAYVRNDTAARDEKARKKGQAVPAARRKLWRESVD